MTAITASVVMPVCRVASGVSFVAVIVGGAPELAFVDEEVGGVLAQPADSAIKAVESNVMEQKFMVDVFAICS